MAEVMDVQTNPAEAWSALKKSHSSALELLDFQVEEGSKKANGFLSKIYTLVGQVRVDGQQVKQIRVKVKKMSDMTFRWKLAVELGVFEQEIGFFEKCIPILLKNCPDLPVVKCFQSNLQTRVLFMEDLNDLGYTNVVYNLFDLHSGNLKLEHIELAMKTVAKFHVASLGVNWADKFPDLFQQDPYYERGCAKHAKNGIKKSVDNIFLPAARLIFPDNKKIMKSVQWLASDECYQLLTNLSKADPNGINVLNHGDCWANNFLFKTDSESKKPVDAKMIDFQICRYAPISRDLLQLLYISTSSEFRNLHESELIRVYVDTFNENCVKMGRSERLTHKQLFCDYNQSKLHGLIKAMKLCPIVHVQGLLQKGADGRMNKEVYDRYLSKGVDADLVMREACQNDEFKNELRSMLEELGEIHEKQTALRK